MRYSERAGPYLTLHSGKLVSLYNRDYVIYSGRFFRGMVPVRQHVHMSQCIGVAHSIEG